MDIFRIEKIELENLGPFGHLVLQFPNKPANSEPKAEVHIFTGENGTGKTTLLEVIAKAVSSHMASSLTSKFRNYGPTQTEDIFFGGSNKNRNNPKSWFKVEFNFGQPFSISRRPDGSFVVNSDNFVTKKFYARESGEEYAHAFFAYSGNRSINQVSSITEIKELQDDPLANSVDFARSINPERFLNWVAFTKMRGIIARDNGDKNSSDRYSDAIERIESTIETIIGKTIKFSLDHQPLSVIVQVGGENLDFNVLPEGLKSIISWISDLFMRMDRIAWKDDLPVFERNFILLLDEIEVHMHPAWQRKILPAIQDLFPNAQIFVSTHSPFVVGSIDGAWIYKFEKPNGNSSLAEGYPKQSEDAKSYFYWLREVFGIEEQFGPEVEKDMKEFYHLRNLILQGANGTTSQKLLSLGRSLAEQSQEVNQIIQMELLQINRQKGMKLSL